MAQWANEAQRLKANELREYVAPRRYALLLAALRASRGRLLDDLTLMLLKFTGKIVWRSQKSLADTRVDRGHQGDALIAVLAEMLSIIGWDRSAAIKLEALEATSNPTTDARPRVATQGSTGLG